MKVLKFIRDVLETIVIVPALIICLIWIWIDEEWLSPWRD